MAIRNSAKAVIIQDNKLLTIKKQTRTAIISFYLEADKNMEKPFMKL